METWGSGGPFRRLRSLALPIGPTIVGVLIAIATNYVFDAVKSSPLNYQSLLIGALLLCAGAIFYLLYAVFIGEKDAQRSDFARAQIRHALRSILINANACLEGKLNQRVNIRYYQHKKVGRESRLYQDKEIHVLSTMRSTEEPFTYLSVDEKNMVMCEAFRTRSHKFKVLPDEHFDKWYSESARRAIDPTQKWILAIPVLPVGLDGTVPDTALPFGVLAFYSNIAFPTTSHPDVIDDAIYLSLQSARAFASILSLSQAISNA
jgi:hypothetical protein